MTKVRASLYHRHRFPAEIIAEAVWLYFRFPLRSLDEIIPTKSVAAPRALAINGTWTRLSLPSTVSGIFCGALLIKMALFLKNSCKNAAIPRQPSGLFVNSCQDRPHHRVLWWLISLAPMEPPTGRLGSQRVITVSIKASTIGPRIPISRYADESGL